MQRNVRVSVSMDLEFRAPKLIIVKAYTRTINGKVVKVRTHYRRVWGRTVVTARVF